MRHEPALALGLMSGTSLDGVDGVLVRFGSDGTLRAIGHVHQPFEPSVRAALLALNATDGDEIHRSALAGNAVARAYASVAQAVLVAAGVDAAAVTLVGAHGQTVRHRPGEFDGTGYTVQLLNAALLAEVIGIDVVCDFRSRDVAAGGQGAPLVPAAHRAMFSHDGEAVAVLNLGGIANLTLLPAHSVNSVLGFDCGPGNALMDGWCERHTGQAFDDRGRWAASGKVIASLLQRLLSDDFFARPPPKSTGRDLFHRAWLDMAIADSDVQAAPQDVQATLAELTAVSAAAALRAHAPATHRLLVCGGGAYNKHLMRRLEAHLPGIVVASTLSAGVPPDQVEAIAFAWLAMAFAERHPGNLPSVTGARGPRVLGALYPAR